ncbi:MAG: hypothetical protein HDR71_12015 [Lachnospiraceae bacterium]|nr:hypothetical protein [Lachnospiraceae bacterium]
MKVLLKIKSFIFPIIGVICILWPGHITGVLPYLLGGAMVVVGLLIGVSYFRDKQFLEQSYEELVYSIIMLIMGLAFIAKGGTALGAIGTTWAIIGIRKAANSLNQAIQQIYMKEHFARSVVEFLIRIMLALILLFDPYEKFSTHIVILGLELIVSSIRLKSFENH